MTMSSAGAKSKSSIARSAWPIELHSGEKPQLKWLLDDYYDISYESFFRSPARAFVAAGRCLSAEHEAMASARVTAQCFSYGQAIGMAAGDVAARRNVAARTFGFRSTRRVAQGWCGDLKMHRYDDGRPKRRRGGIDNTNIEPQGMRK